MPAQQGASPGRSPVGRGTGAANGSPLVAPARGSAAGRLEATQVRAMFDRIAGVYDLMNTAMTAGLHHRWRARAADEARAGPGGRGADVANGNRHPRMAPAR